MITKKKDLLAWENREHTMYFIHQYFALNTSEKNRYDFLLPITKNLTFRSKIVAKYVQGIVLTDDKYEKDTMKNSFLFIVIALILFQLTAQSQEVVTDSIVSAGNDSVTILASPTNSTRTEIPGEIQIPELITMDASSVSGDLNPESQSWRSNFDPNRFLLKPYYYKDEFILVSPFSFAFENGYQGGWMGGINNHFPLSENFQMNINTYASSSYYGPMYPHRYNNATLSFDMKYQIHDRVRLVGFGEVSLREGMNPGLSPMINGGYNFGGGVELRITKNFGIGVGVVNSYYRNSWTTQPYANPVVW